jgi:pyruvate/2-oxoglutarate dehydrogenase complex dihydrolipoamide dehydrogenase (E3) component
MSTDYDLVIIGDTVAGIHAAVMAAEVQARVALVTQNGTANRGDKRQVLQAAGYAHYHTQKLEQRQLWGEMGTVGTIVWEQVGRWATVMEMTENAIASPTVLASLGIEVINDAGEFCRKPTPGFTVNGRYLRSRTYLLATSNHFTVPVIEGLQSVPYQTPETILHRLNSPALPQSVLIVGHTPMAVELAQSLTRLGLQITLLTSTPSILPQEDPDTASLIQALLEAEGVELLTNMSISRLQQIEGKIWAQIGDRAIEVDGLLLALGQTPDVATLNLDAVGVHWDAAGLITNPKLQTTNPRIYACTNPTDYDAPQIDLYRATIATRNALFLPLLTVKQPPLTWTVNTDPAVARIGLTEPQAVQQYKDDIVVLQQSFKTLFKSRLQGETTGFCKLIVRRNGTILGAHLVGAQADEMIGTIALAAQKNIKVQELATLAVPAHSFSEILRSTASQWQRQQLQQNDGLQDFLEGLFSLRRSWF